MPIPTKLDHCVIHVSDWERSNRFYTQVMGAELVTRPVGFAYRFGDKQLNVHANNVFDALWRANPKSRYIVNICIWIPALAASAARPE